MALDFGKLNFSVSFNPTSAFPLDARCYFESYESAVEAAATAMPAGDSTTVYHYGMTVCVVENGKANLYIIQPDKTLSEVGSSIAIDEKVFKYNEEEKLSLLGFADAVAGAQLTKGADGSIQWVKPDNTTVEGLATEVESLRQDVTKLQTAVGDTSSGLVKDVTDLKTSLENVYNKGETDSAIAAAIANADHLKRQIVEDLPDVGSADENTIYMKEKVSGSGQNSYDEYMVISGAWELLGNTEVDLTQYVTNAKLTESLETKVDKVPGSRLMTDAEGTKLTGIQDNAEKNIINSVSAEFTVSEGRELSLQAIEQSKVTGLPAALAAKATKEELAGYLTTENANSTYATKTELTEGLNGKVSVELGKGLSTNDFTNELKSKLEGVSAGAQVNVIETIKINNSPLQVSDKAVNIPLATSELLGLVKGSSENNKVAIKEDGTMEVNSISLSKVKQEGEEFVINGGTSQI